MTRNIELRSQESHSGTILGFIAMEIAIIVLFAIEGATPQSAIIASNESAAILYITHFSILFVAILFLIDATHGINGSPYMEDG